MIIPAILTSSFKEFNEDIKKLESIFSRAQIDVMDGIFVSNKSFEERDEINDLNTSLRFDLHLMVNDPLSEIEKWKKVKNISQVIFHIETDSNPEKCIEKIRNFNWQVGIALNPETPLTKVSAYYNLIDTVLFMTVHPGRSGAPFVPEVKEKIAEYQKVALPKPKCAVDGGIDENNIAELAKLGVEVFYIGKHLIWTENLKKEYAKLNKVLRDKY